MDHEREIWAVALWVEEHHGAHGPRFIAEQIGALSLRHDAAGVERWMQIARCYAELASGQERSGAPGAGGPYRNA